MRSFQLSRRAVLRGAGASMALPWLEIMQPRKANAAESPLRFACLYSPNGFVMKQWTPTTTGPNWAITPLLKPLEPFKADFNVLSGLGNYTASIAPVFGGSHTRATASMLTQTPVNGVTSKPVMNGVSLDQILAKQIGAQTKFPSLQVGTRGPRTGACEDSYACAYNNNISWSNPTTFLPKQVNPLDVFNRLFGDLTTAPPTTPGMPAPVDNGNFFRKSILDVVAMRANALNARLGTTDKAKIEQYFTAVRDVEMRLARIANDTVPGTGGTPVAACMKPAAPKDLKEVAFPEHLNLMSDMIALAFQCDVTRIATFMFEHAFSEERKFDFLPGVTVTHHAVTHTTNAVQEAKIDVFYVERVAYLLGKLKAMKEGDRTVLDNSIIYFGSEFGAGFVHDHRSLAYIVAGKAGGKWKTGSHINYPQDPGTATGVDGLGNPKDTQLAHLHLTTLRAFNNPQPAYGSDEKGNPMATTTLPEFVV